MALVGTVVKLVLTFFIKPQIWLSLKAGMGNMRMGKGNGERGTGNGESLKAGIFKMGNL